MAVMMTLVGIAFAVALVLPLFDKSDKSNDWISDPFDF